MPLRYNESAFHAEKGRVTAASLDAALASDAALIVF